MTFMPLKTAYLNVCKGERGTAWRMAIPRFVYIADCFHQKIKDEYSNNGEEYQKDKRTAGGGNDESNHCD